MGRRGQVSVSCEKLIASDFGASLVVVVLLLSDCRLSTRRTV